MRLVKPKVEPIDPTVDSFIEPKTEVTTVLKDELDEKSIASDTELMKILEEDSTSDETRASSKKENPDDSDGNILLGALTKLENSNDVENTLATMEVKNEDGGECIRIVLLRGTMYVVTKICHIVLS